MKKMRLATMTLLALMTSAPMVSAESPFAVLVELSGYAPEAPLGADAICDLLGNHVCDCGESNGEYGDVPVDFDMESRTIRYGGPAGKVEEGKFGPYKSLCIL